MLSAAAFGLAFNTKMLEGFIALPALAIVYLIAANGRLRARIGRLLAAGGMLAVITLSWMTIVDLIPKSNRPYVGSSANDTVWNLAVGYNGFGRVTGSQGFGRRGGFGGAGTGAGTGTGLGAAAGTGTGGTFGGGHAGDLGELAHRTGGFAGFGGQAGIGRMFGSTLGGQISWLLPFAAIALVGTLILIGRRPRTDLARASVMLWGGWLLLEFFVLSFQQGIQHSYYTSAMAPPIAALTGIGAVVFYQAYRRSGRWSLVLALAIAVTGAWAFVLLRRTPGWNSWLPWTVAGATVVAVLALAFGWRHARRSADGLRSGGDLRRQQSAGQADGHGRRVAAGLPGRPLAVAGVAGLIAVLAGPAAYAATPISRTIEGTNPVAGPTAGGTFGGPGGFAGDLRDFADLGGAHTGYGGGPGPLRADRLRADVRLRAGQSRP